MGFVVATRAMDYAIELAKKEGVGVVGVHNSTHFGASAQYVQQALDADMISLVFTNSSPALPPHGGAAAFLGANPIAAGAPSGKAHPFLMDMSTTIIARGKLRLGKLTPKCPIID
jgi:L-2-hydroxycarboxylate dehydrogenase (NAD+)